MTSRGDIRNSTAQRYSSYVLKYWLDLFTGKTWAEFRTAGSEVSGFRRGTEGVVARIARGDILLCYVTGIKRWVGALEVIGQTTDTRRIWTDDEFPVRLNVRPLITLEPEFGLPLDHLESKVDFFRTSADRGGYQGFFRRSPSAFKRDEDGALVLDLLRAAESQPVSREVDQRELARRPAYLLERKVKGKNVQVEVSIPTPDPPPTVGIPDQRPILELTQSETRHTEIQAELLQLGAEMGLDVWVARNDRGKTMSGQALGSMRRVLDALPTQFNEITTKTIELIDVLWLRGNSIQAAFEIESTTSIYSGLLRMSDLLALQPNIDIDLYLIAPDERRSKVEQEILRPTFQLREKPLSRMCGFISFSFFSEKLSSIRRLGLGRSLRPDFLKAHAEYFGQRPDSSSIAGRSA